MKKIMLTALTVIAILVMSTAVFAATPGDGSKIDQRIETLQERQLASKQDEFEAFRNALAEDRLKVLQNRENNISAIEQSNQLRLSLAQAIKELKDSNASLSEETTARLKADSAQVADLVSSLKDTKGQIRDTLAEYKGFIKEKDYAAMDTAFAEISAIQAYRYDVLNQINSILADMNDLLASSR